MPTKYKILLVEDEEGLREPMAEFLDKEGYLVEAVGTGAAAVKCLRSGTIDLVILDIRLEGTGPFSGKKAGLEILKEIRQNLVLDIPVIMMTAYGSQIKEMTIGPKAMELGAEDYLEKPVNSDVLKIVIMRALEKQRLLKVLEYYKSEKGEKYDFGSMVGKSKKMQEIYGFIKKVAPQDTSVFITGETGTGKELVAYAIHSHSPRVNKPFIVVNCAAIPSTILESELFGVIANYPGFHNKEALVGKFELADGGTIFFDEIGDMALELQAKILRVFENKEVAKLGEKYPKKIDVRIICATNKNLRGEIEKVNFREDLFQRINVFPISLPPLRERKEDIPLLIQHLIEKYAKETKKNVSRISDEALKLLMQYDYPGNIRELENLIERAVILTEGETIPLEALPTDLASRRKLSPSTKSRVLDSDDLPSLAEVLSLYDAPSYIKIPNLEVQKRVFLKTFIQGKGTLEDVKDKLGISHGAVHEHFRLVRETIFILLCRHHGNIENLAKTWNVSVQDLQVAISKKNRLLKFVAGIMKDYGEDEQKTAHRFNVTLDEFREAFRRLRELSQQ